ncbi:glycosyltransferase family 4 protein [Pseudorhodoplanes sp.]|uniref:glycosyltransferase family 4 protein n=1 Tax=Pseudorhodoplanes sp. TaxID=1934341 RepID=UPI002D078B0C|nr:glycosyltransferase family 4 protein [Pseudorhodoplanes sp.]HWV54423.1 glycosyltransferase family 4 protein [Pseudorhodoplanes sp.]
MEQQAIYLCEHSERADWNKGHAAPSSFFEHTKDLMPEPSTKRVSTGPVLVYLVTEDWYFVSHRLPMALAAQRAGYRVHVATRVKAHGTEIEARGFTLHPLDWQRGSTNPLSVASIVRQVRDLYRHLKPDLVHHVALQPSIVGSLAAIGLPVMTLNALAGLGFVFTSRSVSALAMRPVLTALVRVLFNKPLSAVLVQNPDDREAVQALGVASERVHLIPGSGIDTDVLKPLPEPSGEVTAAFVGRLLDDKGVRPLVEAQAMMAEHGEKVRLMIAGDRDPANPASIPAEEVEGWRQHHGVKLLGHVSGIEKVWERAHIAVLPSRREGLPKSLLEAAAFGRPIVATDVPGCREIARHNVNAFLVPPDDPAALAGAISVLARDPALRRRLGAAGRTMVENEFSSARIGAEIVALYDTLARTRSALLPGAAAAS